MRSNTERHRTPLKDGSDTLKHYDIKPNCGMTQNPKTNYYYLRPKM
jgi:hypothetical protein